MAIVCRFGILSNTQVHLGDILTITGRVPDTTAAAKALGFLDRRGDSTDVAFIAAGTTLGTSFGQLVTACG